MSNNLQDDRIAAALLEENDTSSDDENFLPSSDDEADHISEASEVRSDTDVEDAENNLEPYLDGTSQPFYLGKDGRTNWSNKTCLPPQFKTRREEKSSVFGFQKDITIVSYIPKPRKCVHMMSSLHHDDEVDPESGDQRKPSIITFYNSTKSGVDVVDKLARTYDVTRNCKRWPLTVFFSMLNHAGINAFIVYILNNSIERKKTNLRKNFIKQLGLSLLEDHIRKRKDNTTKYKKTRA
ncbi:hypothetical protein HW555_001214 [Spodoptera exigua]|uniref:PiggyBac transposable element-derived protein domain-containing protein n=1 Tax=Spodoptera exigua TaxID=7107 RepID=A0A835L865_SPOEX|nr:hypothetical protein HW555_001214 [Spodoptera exigua]